MGLGGQGRRLGGPVEGELVAAAEGGAVEVAAVVAGEDEGVVGDGRPEAGEGLGDLGCHGVGAELAALRRGEGAGGVLPGLGGADEGHDLFGLDTSRLTCRGSRMRFFWTCRPSGRRNFAYQTGPAARSTRNTCPLIERARRNWKFDTNNHPSRDTSGTRPLLQGWRENDKSPAHAGLLVHAPTRNRT